MIDFDARARQWDDNPLVVERGCKIAAAIRARAALSPQMRALDVGCGTGLLALPLAGELAHITCIDTSAGMLKVLDEKLAALGVTNIATLHHDLSANDLPEGGFDLIMSSMALHHIKDTRAIFASFAAHLRPGGRLCIADLDPEDGSFHGAGADVHRGFERAALGTLATESGFSGLAFDTVFTIVKEQAAGPRDYPVFLLSARKPA